MTLLPNYEDLDALDLAALVACKDISATELLDEAISRIETIDPIINAMAFKFYDRAKAQIAAGLPQGMFTGVPFALKDIGAPLAGTPCAEGTRALRDNVSTQNGTLVDRYLAAGLVILGKTTTSEFALVGSIENELHGQTRNPWNTGHSTGGSSGGAAAAVAARMLPAAHGNDGGGSIRLPSACCGVFGFKPSRGRVTAGPFAGEGTAGTSTNHVITRSVRDSAAMLDITCFPNPGDPYVAPAPERPYLAEIGRPSGRLRIGVMTELPDLEISADAVAAAETGARICEDLGHFVEPMRLPFEARPVRRLFRELAGIGVAARLEAIGQARGRPVEVDEVEPHSWLAAQAGNQITAPQYLERVREVHALGRSFAPWFQRYDVVITPTIARPAYPLGVIAAQNHDLLGMHDVLMKIYPFTQVYNMTGQPAMSMPLYRTAEGLPIGVQFAAAYGRDGLLFCLASQIETAAPWAGIKPDLRPAS